MGIMRTAITPGRLYWLLTREFHEKRPEHCSACRMPLPELVETSGLGEANWKPGGLPPVCDECAVVIGDIIARHQAAYDIFDPVSRPISRPGRQGPEAGALYH
jgi:hypothetical protein